jgi:intraflagellar transport protein 52
VYPYGATLNVAKPAVAVLSTGSVSFPANRPVCALHKRPGSTTGKLAVLGSGHVFADQYIDKESNSVLWEIIMNFLTEDLILHAIDADDPEVSIIC